MHFLKRNRHAENQKDSRKIFRLVTVLLLVFLGCGVPQMGMSQSFNPLITFSVETCTLDEALEKLFAEYELNVAFSKAELSKIRIEGYSCSYKSVEDVLTDLLRGTNYGYKKIGKQYVIRKIQIAEIEPTTEEGQIIPVKPPKETITQKTDIIVNPTADTVRIFDTVRIVETVMRYDTVIQHEVKTDTVVKVVRQGLMIPWPKFKDNGWFVTFPVTLCATKFNHAKDMPELENGSVEVKPDLGYCIGLEGGYKHDRWSGGISLSYRSVRYRFLLEKTDFEGDYYQNDTLDIYYTVHPSGDTTYQYILDSTYIPLTTTNYAYRDVNRLDYLGLGAFVTFDFIKLEHFRGFVKAGASLDFLVNYTGSLHATELPYHAPIVKEQVEPIRFSCFGGIGGAFKVANRIELIPEIQYRMTNGSLYRVDFPFDIKMTSVDFRLGLTYYF